MALLYVSEAVVVLLTTSILCACLTLQTVADARNAVDRAEAARRVAATCELRMATLRRELRAVKRQLADKSVLVEQVMNQQRPRVLGLVDRQLTFPC